jgi:AhpD family alkylhydroperoxidase
MTERLNPYLVAPDLAKPLIDLAKSVAAAGLEPRLAGLVNIRASQINGCAICLNMHMGEAHALGETEERIVMLDAWQESPLYNARERAALAWTEALTRLADTHAPDETYEACKAQFNQREQVTLTLMIGLINTFNRLGVGFRVGHPRTNQRQAA